MSFGTVLQIALDIFLLSGIVILWARYRKNDGDDPRMSRSLQLLQSKISILEDLSDRIDEQLTQASTLMEHKKKELDARIAEADRTLHTIQQSRDKSLEVAKIFQDRIPHAEIIERQRTIEYVKAARLAHQGIEVSEIVKQVNLPAGEVEFIAKMNREQLQFSLEDLPDWATGTAEAAPALASKAADVVAGSGPLIEFPTRIELPKMNESVQNDLAEIGERMRKAASGNAPVASSAAPAAATAASPVSTPAPAKKAAANTKDAVMTSLLNKAAASVNASAAIRAAATELSEIQNAEAPVLKPRASEAAAPRSASIAGVPARVSNTIEILHTPTPPKADAEVEARTPTGESVIVQKIVFPKIEVNQHLS